MLDATPEGFSPHAGFMPPDEFETITPIEPAQVHLTLRRTSFLDERYIALKLRKNAVVKGFRIRTSKARYLQKFTVEYEVEGYIAMDQVTMEFIENFDQDTPFVRNTLIYLSADIFLIKLTYFLGILHLLPGPNSPH